ncbi:hypothetical protein B0T16DRAFT_462400 [Cercophora newfieldiana]|uniref:Uncharacterized protein n=1 Tax=Cercophora newfieldiana TaxID=92897 RepID=A0AA39XSL9_9PEZI|nr:hypothetical protein B0T16DRAFT_462400 [Cercophora newfieldiana]
MASLWDDVRRPNLKVREKFSSLVRRGSLRSIKTKAAGHGGIAFAQNAAPILEVDLERVKSLRLAEGWLEDASPPSPARPSSGSKRRNGPGRRGPDGVRESEREVDVRRYSTTPIADLFSMSTDQLTNTLETISRKPVPAPQPAPPMAAHARPAPPEPEQLPVVRISLRHSVVEVDEAPSGQLSGASAVGGNSSSRHSIRQVNLLRSVGDNTSGLRVSANGGGDNAAAGTPGIGVGVGVSLNATHKRYSASSIPSIQVPSNPPAAARTEMPPPSRPPVLQIKPPEIRAEPTPATATPSSATPLEVRRRSWQPAASPAPTPTQTTNPPLQRTLSTRPPSAALNSSRLAWIRELENKSSSPSSPGASRGKVSSGGVASKLAMFEHLQKKPKQLSAAPMPLSRSNTSSSRVSSGGTSLGYGGEASISTARTSMDSDSFSTTSGIRSKRSSLVMAYYDEGFREKMEGVVAKQLNPNDEEEGKDKVVVKEQAEVEVEKRPEAEKAKPAEEGKTEEEDVKSEAEEARSEGQIENPTTAHKEEEDLAETVAATDVSAQTAVAEQCAPEPAQAEEKEQPATVPVVVNDVVDVSPQGQVVELAEKGVEVQVISLEENPKNVITPGTLEETQVEVLIEPTANTGTPDDGRQI